MGADRLGRRLDNLNRRADPVPLDWVTRDARGAYTSTTSAKTVERGYQSAHRYRLGLNHHSVTFYLWHPTRSRLHPDAAQLRPDARLGAISRD
jgi:hypothetical protein